MNRRSAPGVIPRKVWEAPHVGKLSRTAMDAARNHQAALTKPPGSLGRLEELAIHLAGVRNDSHPQIRKKAIIVVAGDHGVAAQGVSAYPAAVTAQMVQNFLRGGAAINVLAKSVGATLVVVDAGVATEVSNPKGLIVRPIGRGTGDISNGPAMTRAQAIQCMQLGMELVREQVRHGVDLIGTGDMGIANTTASSAVCAAITGAQVAQVTGRGTGISDDRLQRKVDIIQQALETNDPKPSDGVDVLAKVGGFEIGTLAGIILAAASHRIPIVLDGFISGAAALIATRIRPLAREFLIAAHVSPEPGHRVALDHLRLHPLLDFDMRLGEGTGAALAMPLLEAAVRVHSQMATFAEAGVSDAEEEA